MASNTNEQAQQQYDEQIRVLRESFPKAPQHRLVLLLRKYNGDIEQVRSRLLMQREARANKMESLETRFAPTVATIQQENPSFQAMDRVRLMRILNRFGGDVEQTRKFIEKVRRRHNHEGDENIHGRRQRREELRTKYATQLDELTKAGVNAEGPCVLRQLEKHQGDTNKVLENITRHQAKKEKRVDLENKYANEIAQLQAEGIEIKNKRVLGRLLEKSNGQVDVVKQRIDERQEKIRQRREYKQKHRCKSAGKNVQGEEGDEQACNEKKRRELSRDDRENLKRLRSAGVRGNPMKVLKIFNECNQSVEVTVARTQEQREQRSREREERLAKRKLLSEAKNAYLTLNTQADWPKDIEQVYLDGNNMMFVVDSLRRLCLKRAGQKTERAIGEIASAWNEQMRIPNVDLIYDSTRQVEQIGTVKVLSAQPQYRTTDDMLIEIARKPENQERNKRTIVVTSDRALAALLQHEGCLLMKPYSWFAHCVMVLTPDLVKHEEITGTTTTTATPTTSKTRYNFDELVHRIAKIDL